MRTFRTEQKANVLDTTHIEISGPCQMCAQPHSVSLPLRGIYAWLNGVRIEDALASEHPSAREFLISGCCERCFFRYFQIGQVA